MRRSSSSLEHRALDCVYMCICTRTRTCARVWENTRTYTHINIHTYTHKSKYTRAHALKYTYTHTHSHSLSLPLPFSLSLSHIYISVHVFSHQCTYVITQKDRFETKQRRSLMLLISTVSSIILKCRLEIVSFSRFVSALPPKSMRRHALWTILPS